MHKISTRQVSFEKMASFSNYALFLFLYNVDIKFFGIIGGISEIGKSFACTVRTPNAIRIHFIFAGIVTNAKDTSSTRSCVQKLLLTTTRKPCNTIVTTVVMWANTAIPLGQSDSKYLESGLGFKYSLI